MPTLSGVSRTFATLPGTMSARTSKSGTLKAHQDVGRRQLEHDRHAFFQRDLIGRVGESPRPAP